MEYPSSSVITTNTCPTSEERLKRVYSIEDISTAVETARVYVPTDGSIYTDPVQFQKAWDVLHVITSDYTWRGGVGRLVDSYLKMSVSRFVRDLIVNTPALQMETMNAVNFMVRDFDNMNDPGFVRLLRAFLFAFPSAVNTVMDKMPQRFIDPETDDIYNALQLAASNEQVPLDVFCTLLEFGADVNCTTPSGLTPMMGSIMGISDQCLYKLRRLIQYGGNIDLYDQSFQTVLHFGAMVGNVRGVRIILEARKQRLEDVEEMKDTEMDLDISGYNSPTYSEDIEDHHETVSDGATDSVPDFTAAIRHMYECRIAMDTHDTQSIESLKRYQLRLRLKSDLYVDPLHLPDSCNETPLSIAAGTSAMDFNARKKMVSMLVDFGADADSDKHVGPSGSLSQNHLCFGIITCHERLGEWAGTFFIMIQIFKGAYRTSLYMDLALANNFLDIDESLFPEGGMSQFNVEEVFKGCKGQRFDFYDRWDTFDKPHDGVDFSLWFRLTNRTTDEQGDDSIETSIVLESSCDTFGPHIGKLTMRFPRGPCPVAWWTNDAPVGITFEPEITMYKHFTLLQKAAMCKYRETRRNMMTVARSMCNPLIKCDAPYNVKGSTAAEILATTLLLDSQAGRFNTTQNTRLLKILQKDRSDMLNFIHKDYTLQQYKDVNAAFHMLNSTQHSDSTQRPAKKSKLVSPFHRFPNDVCETILSFI